MAVSMRRMNGSCRGMALALVLCALLPHNEVHCQDSTDATDTPYTSNATDALGAAPTDATGLGVTAFTDDNKGTGASVEPQTPVNDPDNTVADSITDSTANITGGTSTPVSDQDTAFISTVSENDPLARGDTSVTTAEPGVATQGTEATVTPVSPVVPETEAPVVLVLQPVVECVDKEAVKDKDSVKVELSSESSCSETKRIMEDSAWCTGDCNLQLFQEENSKTLVLTRANGEVKELSENLNSQGIKGQLGVVESAPRWVKHSSTVLVSLLITGLLLAAALIGGYCLKKHSRHNAKCMRLAEEVYPVDEENQGNTLVSVAPLNPIETLEKPANGDSQEATKTQPPPTNGHSTTKTADTEL